MQQMSDIFEGIGPQPLHIYDNAAVSLLVTQLLTNKTQP